MGKKENVNRILGLLQKMLHSHHVHRHNIQPWLKLELTKEQLRVIFLLSFKGKASPGEVADAFGVPRANVTSVIDKLVGKGLISRQENPDDRRSQILTLTEEGRKKVEELLEMQVTVFRRILERMDEGELDSLRFGLEGLVTALKEEREVNGCN